MADDLPSITPGDYVRIKRGVYESEFGYVLRQAEDIYSATVDQCYEQAGMADIPLPAVINCTLDNFERVRGHTQQVVLDVQDFAHQSFPIHGFTASTWASENNVMDPESPLGRLHRPTIAELPPPHTVDSVFADQDLKEVYLRLFRGEYSLIEFPNAKSIRIGFPTLLVLWPTRSATTSTPRSALFRIGARKQWHETHTSSIEPDSSSI